MPADVEFHNGRGVNELEHAGPDHVLPVRAVCTGRIADRMAAAARLFQEVTTEMPWPDLVIGASTANSIVGIPVAKYGRLGAAREAQMGTVVGWVLRSDDAHDSGWPRRLRR